MKYFKIIITGIVQGVGFRPFLYNLLDNYKIKGTIQNSGNLGITLYLQLMKKENNITSISDEIKEKAPKMAYIEEIYIKEIQKIKNINFNQLSIIESDEGSGKGLTLPPDISICKKCIEDFNNQEKTRFFKYPFISCAQCGPRYTIMKSLPYDRKNSMVIKFPFCEGCEEDYSDIRNRRFRAQTFNCNLCGPFYYIAEKGEAPPKYPQPGSNSIKSVIKTIKEGGIVAIKGIGGVNLICRADKYDVIQKLRDRKKNRKEKPFAVMLPNIESVKKYCEVDSRHTKLLTSFRKPIVLLPRKNDVLPGNIAPGLHNLGIILPYMGLHYLLFEGLENIPLIYTSGNETSIPMGIDNIQIFDQLHEIADIFLLHNREIYQRCDDSVIRPVLNNPTLIRRSRGFIPEYYNLPFKSKFRNLIAVGAELNSTGAIAKKQRIFPTQHIGNVNNLETNDFLLDSLQHLRQLLKIDNKEIDCIARDLNPIFQSTKLSNIIFKTYKEIYNSQIQLQSIQHHHSHLASLMVDHKMGLEDEIIAITIDGVGFGENKQPWGGEILQGGYCDFTRLGNLNPIPMIGGDQCAKSPSRMLICELFANSINYSEINITNIANLIESLEINNNLNNGQAEYDYLKQNFQNKIKNQPYTSSYGRLLDSAASLFDVCHKRTYRAEPAMRLESYFLQGEPIELFDLENFKHDSIIYGEKLLLEYSKLLLLPKFQKTQKKRNLAISFVKDISTLFAKVAIEQSNSANIQKIGVTGGVAYNEFIMKVIKQEIEKENKIFLQHKNIAPGDAGISIGQIAVASAKSTK